MSIAYPWPAVVRTTDLVRQGAGSRAPRSGIVRLPSGEEARIAVTTTPVGFGGRRAWMMCGVCGRRVGYLFVIDPAPSCRTCAGVSYPSQRHSRKRSWLSWGRAAHRLARVRAELCKRYLRLARRGVLERLARALEEEVCRGLAAEMEG